MKPWLRQILAVCLLGVCLVLLFRLAPQLLSQELIADDDFLEYWTAGRLNLRGADPFNPELAFPLQLQMGRQSGVPFWNPPWTLPLIMPFGALTYPVSRLWWFFTQIALLLFSAAFIWRFYRGSPRLSWLAWLLAFTFFPTLSLLRKGQIGAVVLGGLVLLLRLSQRQTWWLASLSLLLIAVKPQTLYLVELAWFFWAIRQRRWDLLAGSAIGILLAGGIALYFNPMVLYQYFHAITHQPPPLKDWATPTIGGMLRHFLGPDKLWLQFAPAVLGVVWFCFYWSKHRLNWQWPQQLPLLVAISVLTASYGWTFDYVVLLLVILPVVVGMCQQGWNSATIVTLSLYLAIDVGALAANLSGGIQHDFWYMWLAPALVGWYLLTVRLGLVRHLTRTVEGP
jgi:hypothetical protein